MGNKFTKNEIYKKLGNFKKVQNMLGNSGREIPNQFILYFDGGQVFQSYQSVIAVVFDSYISEETPYYIGSDWDYSRTTGKYRNDFLNRVKKDVKEDLKCGRAVLVEDL